MVKSACVKTARAPSRVRVINLYIDAYSTEWFLHCKFTKLHIIKSDQFHCNFPFYFYILHFTYYVRNV